jgi:hypothetical protein
MSDAFEADWSALKQAVASGRIESPKSEFWDVVVEDFTQGPSADPADLFKADTSRDYNFLHRTRDGAAAAKAWQNLTFLASVAFKRAAHALWDFNLNRPANGHLMAYPRYKRELRRQGLGPAYERFCNELGLSTDSYNTAKLFCYASQVSALPLPSSRRRTLEVGGGTGNMAMLLSRGLPDALHVIVDLPEMLLYSSRTLRHFFPDRPMAFSHSRPGASLELPESGFLFVHHTDARRVPSDAFDLCINIDSFQEMSQPQVAGYLALFQRAAKPGARIFTVNRRKRIGDWDNNPLTYPYGPNKVVRWEADPFTFHSLQAERLDANLIREEIVQK